jgi:hypothetical protein
MTSFAESSERGRGALWASLVTFTKGRGSTRGATSIFGGVVLLAAALGTNCFVTGGPISTTRLGVAKALSIAVAVSWSAAGPGFSVCSDTNVRTSSGDSSSMPSGNWAGTRRRSSCVDSVEAAGWPSRMLASLSGPFSSIGSIATVRHSPGARTLKTNRMTTISKNGQIDFVVFRFMAPSVVMSLGVEILGGHIRISAKIGITGKANRIRIVKLAETKHGIFGGEGQRFPNNSRIANPSRKCVDGHPTAKAVAP